MVLKSGLSFLISTNPECEDNGWEAASGPEESWDSLPWLFKHMDYDKNHKLRTWQILPEQEGKVIAFSKVRGGMGIE